MLGNGSVIRNIADLVLSKQGTQLQLENTERVFYWIEERTIGYEES